LEAANYFPLLDYKKGNCAQIAIALMVTLITNKKSEGWYWVEGCNLNTRRDGIVWEHDWLECDGWAIDGSGYHCFKGKERKLNILVSDAEFYRQHLMSRIRGKWNDQEIREWLFRQAELSKAMKLIVKPIYRDVILPFVS
jgi:hypothetical protein